MKILITGGHGQLGHCMYDALQNPLLLVNNEYVFLSHEDLDITDKGSIDRYLFYHPDVECILNFAAYTNVDYAEDNIYDAFKVNSLGVKNLVDACEEHDIMLFHISTDYVYKDGLLSCNEETECDPINIYAQSKRDGELHIINSNLNHWYIFRTSWLYSEYPDNFFTKILDNCKYYKDLRVVTDEIGSPTYARRLAELIICIIENGYYATTLKSGIYNTSGNGMCSRYDFAANIISGGYNINILGEKIKIKTTIYPIKQEELNLKAKRPHCIIMDNKKIYSCVPISVDHWIYDLQDCITNYEKLVNHKKLEEKMLFGKFNRS